MKHDTATDTSSGKYLYLPPSDRAVSRCGQVKVLGQKYQKTMIICLYLGVDNDNMSLTVTITTTVIIIIK